MDISCIPALSFDIGVPGSNLLDETIAINIFAGVAIGIALAVVSSQSR